HANGVQRGNVLARSFAQGIVPVSRHRAGNRASRCARSLAITDLDTTEKYARKETSSCQQIPNTLIHRGFVRSVEYVLESQTGRDFQNVINARYHHFGRIFKTLQYLQDSAGCDFYSLDSNGSEQRESCDSIIGDLSQTSPCRQTPLSVLL